MRFRVIFKYLLLKCQTSPAWETMTGAKDRPINFLRATLKNCTRRCQVKCKSWRDVRMNPAAGRRHIWNGPNQPCRRPSCSSLVLISSLSELAAMLCCPICRHIAEQVATTAEGIACCHVGGPSIDYVSSAIC